MFRKRWGGGGGRLHGLPVVVGGRGKRADHSEIYNEVRIQIISKNEKTIVVSHSYIGEDHSQ